MTRRRSKRELEHALDELGGMDGIEYFCVRIGGDPDSSEASDPDITAVMKPAGGGSA